MGGLFLSGSFHSATTPKSSSQPIAIKTSSSPLPIANYKTASILGNIKSTLAPSSSTSSTPSPAVSGSPASSPSTTDNLPPLQRISPTPPLSSVPSPTPSPSTTPSQEITPVPTPSNTPKPTPTLSPTPEISSTPSPTPTPSQTSESIYVVSTVPLVYKQKTDAQLQIQTYPQASCGIKVTLPSGSISGNNALVTKIADSSGFITWIWGISWNTKTGTGKIDLNCTYDSQSYSKSVEFTVTTS